MYYSPSSVTIALCTILLHQQLALAIPASGTEIAGCSSDTDLGFTLPLFAHGSSVKSCDGYKVPLNCINWTGAESKDYVVSGLDVETIDNIAKVIKKGGFNCIRLTWSLELMKTNAVLKDNVISAEQALKGMTSMKAFEWTVNRLTYTHNLMIVLDNHVSDAVWGGDTNGLWFNDNYSEQDWIDSWINMAKIFRWNSRVIGFELRNELHGSTVGGQTLNPGWITSNSEVDFYRASKTVSDLVHKEKPGVLIFVGTSFYSAGTWEAEKKPLDLNLKDKVVYIVHDYEWFHHDITNFSDLYKNMNDKDTMQKAREYFKNDMDGRFGNFSRNNAVWLGEIGRGMSMGDTVSSPTDLYWDFLISYIKTLDLAGYAYWRLDNYYSNGGSNNRGNGEYYALINKEWNGFTNDNLLKSLQSLNRPVSK